MESTIFAVNDEPYCVWEADLRARNLEFLNGLDPEYFSYLLDVYSSSEDEKRSIIGLRIALHHSTETMFSLLGALIQAPVCSYAWVAKCSNSDLRKVVKRISQKDDSLLTTLSLPSVSWTSVAAAVFSHYQPSIERQTATISGFADLWAKMAEDVTEVSKIDEYNSLKHGFRVRPGGFGLSIGQEHTYGVAPPSSEMVNLGHSAYGATFYKLEKFGSKSSVHLRSRRTSVNWSAERTILLFQLVQFSINNTVSALKIANGVDPKTCLFVRPEHDEDFKRPWDYTPGVMTANFDYVLDEAMLPSVSKQDLLDKLKKNNIRA